MKTFISIFKYTNHFKLSLLLLLLSQIYIYVESDKVYAAVGDLYAVTGASCTLSTLYTLNPSNGSVISTIGAVNVSGTQLRHVAGIAIHPSTGVMYGVVNDSNFTDGDNCSGGSRLISIDPATGNATNIGSMGTGNIPDISFDPFGTLYAWSESSDDLYKINLGTGAATKVGECNCGTAATGLAVDSKGAMYLKNWDTLSRMSHGTGARVNEIFLDDLPHNLLAFDDSDVLFTVKRTGGSDGFSGSTGYILQTINIATGALTDVGDEVAIGGLSAIEFDRGVITPPNKADLSLTKVADNNEAIPGDAIEFTITVSNGGPDSATGVEVTDLLPDDYDYVSDDSGGDYNSATGVWTVGTLTNGASAILKINVTAMCGDTLNIAEVTASNEFDPDSVPDNDIPSDSITPPDEDDWDSIDPLTDNDDCVDARSVSVPSTTLGTTTCSTDDGPLSECNGETVDGPGVWYRVTGTGHMITATTNNAATDYDTKLHVYCANCDYSVCITGDDDSGGGANTSEVVWCSREGDEYLIFVSGFGGDTGNFGLEISDGSGCSDQPSCPVGDVVDIDIIPGKDPNVIKSSRCGNNPISVDIFGPLTADPATLKFGKFGASPTRSSFRDVNRDGSTDLRSTYRCGNVGFEVVDTLACIMGGSAPSTSTCCTAHSGTGCNNSTCEGLVCDIDSSCCGSLWDSTCAEEANSICGDACDPLDAFFGCGPIDVQ